MQSRSFKARSLAELETILDSSKKLFSPTLAIVFAHIDFDMQKVADVFQKQQISCIGATSAGEFIDGEIGEPSIAFILMDMNPSCFIIGMKEISNDLRETVRQLAIEGTKAFRHPAFIVLASGITNDGEVIVKSIQEVAGETVPLYGGFASENMKFDPTYIMAGDRINANGIATLVIDSDKISVTGQAAGGWKPIGIIRTITKSEGNKVYTIDNEPALDLIARYMRMSIDDFRKGTEMIARLSTKFQLQLYRKDSYSVMRAPILADVDEKSMVYTGHMPEGGKVQFTILPSFDVIDNVIREFTSLKEEQEAPEAVLLFSCKAREMIFGPMVADEVERIRKIWEAPMSGFLSYGEMGKVRSQSEYHGMMCSLVLLKEKQLEPVH